MENRTGRELKGTAYEIFMLLLSLLSAVNTVSILLARLVAPQGGPGQQVILLMDVIITPMFVFDFAYRLRTAPSRGDYLLRRWGWADLVACVPMLRILRGFRCARVIRLLRARGREAFLADLSASRAPATFLLTIFLTIVVVEVAGASIFYVESAAPDGNIRSASDAIWWGLVTITTVGYGDRYPVTNAGRVIGAFLLFAGIGLFSVLTGFIANVFLEPRRRPRVALAPNDPRSAIFSVRALLAEQEERTDAIRRELDALERAFAGQVASGGPASGPGVESNSADA